jgi:putative ABC transport system permease protein
VNPTDVVLVDRAPLGAPMVRERPAEVVAKRRRPVALGLVGRLARRELRRRPGRTLLVALLVAVPAAGMVVAAVLARTEPLSPAEAWQRQFGAADFAHRVPGPASADRRPGARMVTVRSGGGVLHTTAGRRVEAIITDLPVADPLTEGMVRMVGGRAPSTKGEVLVSPTLAARLGIGIGDPIELDRPAALTATVVGVGNLARDMRAAMLVLGPGQQIVDFGIRDQDRISPADIDALVGVAHGVTTEDARYWTHERGLRPSPALAPRAGEDGEADRVMLSWIVGAVIATAAGIIITSAFGIGGRRQLTTVGLLAINGAPAPVVRRILVIQGAVTGAIGTVLGLAMGAATLLALWPHTDRIWPMHRPTYRFQPLDLVPIVLIGVVASTVAAAVPAYALGRVPVLSALAGRRPVTAVPDRLTDGGVAVFTVGIGFLAAGIASSAPGGPALSGSGFVSWIAVGSLGALLVLLGMCALTPAVVGRLEGLARWLPGPWRLAARSLARRRGHAAALVAAVCASAALTLGASSFVVVARDLSYGARPGEVPLDQVRVGAVVEGRPAPTPESFVRRVRDEMPAAEVFRLTATGPHRTQPDPDADAGGPTAWRPSHIEMDRRPIVADDTALSVYRLSPYAREQLERAGAIAAAGAQGPAMIEQLIPAPRNGVAIVPAEDAPGLDTILVTQAAADELDFVTEPGPVVLRTNGPLDDGLRAALRGMSDSPGGSGFPSGPVSRGTIDFTAPRDAGRMMLAEVGLSAGSVLVTLLVIAVGLSLAAAETRRERELLTIAGASPGTIARVSARKAVLVVLIGTVLAMPVGLLPAWATLDATGRSEAFVLPWRTIVLLTVVVPLVTGLATRLASALGQRWRPVRLSTMAVD